MKEQYTNGENFDFRKAEKSEADAVFALYKSVVGTQFCVWNDEYPGHTEIAYDIETDNLFVLKTGGRIVGAISIVPETELDDFDFWSSDKKVGEFARVVIHPQFQGKRLAKVLVLNVLDVMKKRGYESVHISVATQNIPAQKTYKNLGFVTVGEKEMWNNRYYLCELKLK